MESIHEIEIRTFINPHLFWIFKFEDKLQRIEIEQNLSKEFNCKLEQKHVFSKAEVVAVQTDRIWRRGSIEDIQIDSTDKNRSRYEVWLLDYGVLIETNEVYKLEGPYKELPSLVKQFCLNNVVFLDENLDLSTQHIVKKLTINPTAGSRNVALHNLEGSSQLFYTSNKICKGILFGDILYKKNRRPMSLRKTLIDQNILEENEILFENIQEKLSDKSYQMLAIRQLYAHRKMLTESKIDPRELNNDISMRTSRSVSLSSSSCSSVKLVLKESPEKSKVSVPKQAALLKLIKHKRQSLPKRTEEVTSTSSSSADVLNESNVEMLKVEANTLNYHTDSLNNDEEQRKEYKTAKMLSVLQRRVRAAQEKGCKTILESETKSVGGERIDSHSIASDATTSKVLENSRSVIFKPAGQQNFGRHVTKKSKGPSSDHYGSESSVSKKKDAGNKWETKTENTFKSKESIKSNISMDKDGNYEICKKSVICTKGDGVNMEIKPFCSCKRCRHWTDGEGWVEDCEKFDNESSKAALKIIKPKKLLKTAATAVDVKIIAVDFKSMANMMKSSSFQLLVHGPIIPSPIERIPDAPFNSAIQNALKKLTYVRTKKIQAYVWPAITRSMNVCYINRKSTGKTMAYIPPICSFMMDRFERYKDLKKFRGPIVIILCHTSNECEEIFDLMMRIFDNWQRPKIHLVTYPFTHINLSYVDVLITLPPILNELLKKNAINLKRLCHLVLEEADIILDKNKDDIDKILKTTSDMLEHRICRNEVQLIMSARHWTLNLEKFIKALNNIPLICIGNYLEAAIYGRIDLKLKCVEFKAKRDATISVLKNKFKFFKTIVLCNKDIEIESLEESFQLNGIAYISIPSDLDRAEMEQLKINWETSKVGDYAVLVCTDLVLHSFLGITSATFMVHFSLPEMWTMLMKRFSCMLENYKSPLVKSHNKMVCETYILTDETCVEQIPRLLSLLQNYNVQLNQFQAYSEQINSNAEKFKIRQNVPLCTTLKLFGNCTKKNCPERHMLDNILDRNDYFPQTGTIKFKVQELKNVNHFGIVLIEHVQFNGRSTICARHKNPFTTEQLTNVLSVDREGASEVTKGHVCAYHDCEEFDDVFRKCRVLDVLDDRVRIEIFDYDRTLDVTKSNLYKLPEREQSCFDAPIELIVANCKPPYKDENFSARCFFTVKDVIEKIDYESSVFTAEIRLQLGNTIWVNNILEEIILPDTVVYKENFTKTLLHLNLMEIDNSHLKNIYKLCENAGFHMPVYDRPAPKVRRVAETQVKAQWAFLQQDVPNRIIFSSAVTPDEMYVRLEKYIDLLCNLEKDIIQVILKQGLDAKIEPVAGKYYLAKDSVENKFCRVLVEKIEGDEALCFCVDYGDEMKSKLEDMRYLPNNLITKLPFQSILCRLYGVMAIDSEWVDEATDLLYNYSLEPGTVVFRTLHVKTCGTEKGFSEGQCKYPVLLKDTFGVKPVLINKLLIDCGLGIGFHTEAIADFDVPVDMVEENEEEIDEILEIFQKTDMAVENHNPTTRLNGDSAALDQDLDIMDNFELQIYNIEEFTNDLLRSYKKSPVVNINNNVNNLPAIIAAPPVDHCTPEIYWSQTQTQVKIGIKLHDVVEYKISIKKQRWFLFKTKMNEKTYVINITLFENVEKEYDHRALGREVKITFSKCKNITWPRLILHLKRMRNIHYEMTGAELEDEPHKLFLDLGDVADGGSSVDEEDDPMVTFVSDLDSDMDFELADDSD